MSEEIVTRQEAVPDVPEIHLVARDPQEMAAAQANITTWIQQKLAAITAETAEWQAAIDTAMRNGWEKKALESALNKATHATTYYEKLLAAVQAGYTIIPNFPIALFAVRVKRQSPLFQKQVLANTGYYPSVSDEKAQILPAGTGRYVSPQQLVQNAQHIEMREGKEVRVRESYPVEHGEVEFPLIAARPLVMDAAAEAMALRLFDQIGICAEQKGDPLIIGQIMLSRRSYGTPTRMASFLIAWHLNLNDL